MGIFSKIMGTHSERELKRVYPIVDKIEAMGPAMEKLSDEELRAKTDEFKKRLSEGETLDDLLVEAYAVVREAATRVLGMRHYRVQLIGGVILGVIINVAGYSVGRALVYATPEAAMLKFPFQVFQAAFGAAVSMLLCFKAGLLTFWDKFSQR